MVDILGEKWGSIPLDVDGACMHLGNLFSPSFSFLSSFATHNTHLSCKHRRARRYHRAKYGPAIRGVKMWGESAYLRIGAIIKSKATAMRWQSFLRRVIISKNFVIQKETTNQ